MPKTIRDVVPNMWEHCHGQEHITTVSGTVYRLVESQEQVATLQYVDSLEEQALLEEMLEAVKPPYPDDYGHYDYLLKTPFRYPPLDWGSRFGRPHENSLFYGASNTHVALAESAYYRFIFWDSMDAAPIKNNIRTEHTLFSARYHSNNGVQLHQPPFNEFYNTLTHPNHYQPCQLLGSAMRASHVDVFEYCSARAPQVLESETGYCVGLFTPYPFVQKQVKDTQQWLCELSANEVLFKNIHNNMLKTYPIEDFYYENQLPLPA